MAFLFLKNVSTFFLMMVLLLAALIWKFFNSSPVCQVRYEGVAYFSCEKFSELPIYHVAYTFILLKAVAVSLAIFFTYEYRNPGTLRCFEKHWDSKCYTFERLVNEVATLLRSKLDLHYVLIDAGKHLTDVIFTSFHIIVEYFFYYFCSAHMDHLKETGFKHFFSVENCSFHEGALLIDCEVNYGTDLKVILIVLLVWHMITILAVVSHMIVQFCKYSQLRKKLNRTYFTKLEDWLCNLCEEDSTHFDEVSRSLGMKDFGDAAQRLVLDPKVNKYASKEFGYPIDAAALVVDTYL